MMFQLKIKERIKREADENYKNFSAALIPDVDNVLGVRIPVLRKIAKEIYKTGQYEDFLKSSETEFLEETMLQAIIIGMLKKPATDVLVYIKDFVPKINNWAVCDCFCSGLKFTKTNMQLVWRFLQPYFYSCEEYELRFAYVMLLNYFICDSYIDEILKLVDEFKDEKYYSKMALAWLVSECFVKQREKTLMYLQKSKLSKWTYNKSIQKICESHCVNKNDKNFVKSLKI